MKLYWAIYYRIFKPTNRTDKLIKECRLKGIDYKVLTTSDFNKCDVVGEVDFHVFYEKALQTRLTK